MRPRTKIKKALKSRVEIEVRQGWNWTKLKVWSQSEVQLRGIRSRITITHFAKMAPFCQNGTILELTVHLLLQRGCLNDLLPEAFYASSLHQIGKNLHENDHLTPDTCLHANMIRFGWLTPHRLWHYPKMANPTNHFPTTNLTAYDSYFKPTVGILSSQIKGWDLSPVETKHPSSTTYKYDWISWPGEEKIRCKIGKNQPPPVCFSTNFV